MLRSVAARAPPCAGTRLARACTRFVPPARRGCARAIARPEEETSGGGTMAVISLGVSGGTGTTSGTPTLSSRYSSVSRNAYPSCGPRPSAARAGESLRVTRSHMSRRGIEDVGHRHVAEVGGQPIEIRVQDFGARSRHAGHEQEAQCEEVAPGSQRGGRSRSRPSEERSPRVPPHNVIEISPRPEERPGSPPDVPAAKALSRAHRDARGARAPHGAAVRAARRQRRATRCARPLVCRCCPRCGNRRSRRLLES